ncbi:MAG: hypothetical protein WC044_02040 [Crocinitomicaceae bacterium]
MGKIFLNLIFLVAPLYFSAQVTLSNPYSFYGIGELSNSSDPIQRALGGSSFAYSDSTMVNYYNAASHASLVKGNPLLSISLNGRYAQETEGAVKNTSQFFTLEHLYFAVPFANRLGIAFGLSPYSKRGYNFSSYSIVGGDSLKFNYEGKGNSTKAFVALSANIVKKENLKIAVGSNLGYLFGQTSNSKTSAFVGESSGGVFIHTDRLKSFHYDLSASVFYRLNKLNSFQFSAYYDPSQKLNARTSESLYYFETNKDGTNSTSIVSTTESSEKVISAPALKLGLNYTQTFHRISRKNREFNSNLHYVLEYQKTIYSDYRQEFNSTVLKPYSSDFSRYSLGIQYTPNTDYYNNATTVSFWNRMIYRVGAYSTVLPYQFGGVNYKQFGTTFGIGIPLVMDYSFSSINIGVDLGKRTNTATGAINGNYIGLNVGVILSPMRGDKWFRKVKLD